MEPYTHPFEVRSFTSIVNGEELYVITAGGEGAIRTWKFVQETQSFLHIGSFEGHIRAVSAVVICGMCIYIDLI